MRFREVSTSGRYIDKRVRDRESADKWLSLAMDIGESMLMCGGDVSRVEDTMYRLCRTFSAERIDIFVITSNITATLQSPSYGFVTQTRRIEPGRVDLSHLEKLNSISRRICGTAMSQEEAEEALRAIEPEPAYPLPVLMLAWAIGAGGFCFLFGAGMADAVCCGLIGIIIKCVERRMSLLVMNSFLSGFLCGLLGGSLAGLCVRTGLGTSFPLICIGDVMLLIPGLLLTNSIRDMFSGDTISGMNRFIEALLLSMMIAAGFALSSGWGVSV